MNFYGAVFPEKNFLEKIHKKGGFWGTYPLILQFLVRAMTKKKNIIQKSRLYMPQNCEVPKKS